MFKPKTLTEGEKENRLLTCMRQMFLEMKELYRYRGLVEAVFGNLWSRNSTSLCSRRKENREVEAALMCFTHNLLILVQLSETVSVNPVEELLQQQSVTPLTPYAVAR